MKDQMLLKVGTVIYIYIYNFYLFFWKGVLVSMFNVLELSPCFQIFLRHSSLYFGSF